MISALLSPFLKYISAGLLFLTLILGIALHFERVHGRKLSRRNTELTELRQADRARYEAAQVEAQVKNTQTLARVKAEQEQINENVRSDYRRDLDRLRALPRANQGAPRGSAAPPNGKAPGGTHADGLPNPPCDNLCASEIELRLLYLQNWILDQLKVNPN